jgi:hypothetical protein
MLRPWTSVFAHGHLQISHVFSDGDGHWPHRLARGELGRRAAQTSPA